MPDPRGETRPTPGSVAWLGWQGSQGAQTWGSASTSHCRSVLLKPLIPVSGRGCSSLYPKAAPFRPRRHLAHVLGLGDARALWASLPLLHSLSHGEEAAPSTARPPAFPKPSAEVWSLSPPHAGAGGEGAMHSGKPRIINHTALIRLPQQ